MQRYFVKSFKNNLSFYFFDSDVFHILNVMRMHLHDQVICVYEQSSFLCELVSLNPLQANIIKPLENTNTLNCKVTILMAVIKPHNFEYALQKCTELGISSFIPIYLNRCNFNNYIKLARLKMIAKEAAEQSQQNFIPIVSEPINFDDIKNHLSDFNCFGDLNGEFIKDLNIFKAPKSITILIGPEGGIDNKEIEQLKLFGFKNIKLSNSILRAETAAIYCATIINYIRGIYHET